MLVLHPQANAADVSGFATTNDMQRVNGYLQQPDSDLRQSISDSCRAIVGALPAGLPLSGDSAQTFTDARLAPAVVDRLTFRAHILETGSWRLARTWPGRNWNTVGQFAIPTAYHRVGNRQV